MRDPEAVISPLQLEARLGEPDLRIYDCTTYLEPTPAGSEDPYIAVPGLRTFEEAHIPGADFLDLLGREKELNWTFLSPSALFVPGERTGKFRLGTDQLLTAADGKSWISFEDFAVALADEIERPAHIRQRFTVGY